MLINYLKRIKCIVFLSINRNYWVNHRARALWSSLPFLCADEKSPLSKIDKVAHHEKCREKCVCYNPNGSKLPTKQQ